MNKVFIILLVIISSLNAASFSKSKKILLKKIYFDKQITFYCKNPYEVIDKKAYVVQDEQFYTPRRAYYKSGRENTRAKRVEWEHVMPAYNFARHLSCWKEGGRKACRKDKTFKTMESDMHNLVPAIGEVNGDRSNYKYGADKPKIGQYGNCNVQVDFKRKRAYVDDSIKGDIARAYFYMSEKYDIRLSKSERKMLEVWNKMDPVDKWEKIKNKRIEKIQGNGNRFITQ